MRADKERHRQRETQTERDADRERHKQRETHSVASRRLAIQTRAEHAIDFTMTAHRRLILSMNLKRKITNKVPHWAAIPCTPLQILIYFLGKSIRRARRRSIMCLRNATLSRPSSSDESVSKSARPIHPYCRPSNASTTSSMKSGSSANAILAYGDSGFLEYQPPWGVPWNPTALQSLTG